MPKAQTPAVLTVDFSNVGERTEGGRAAHVPEGDYLFQPKAVELRSKKDDESSKYLSWRMAIFAPEKHKGKTVYHITSLKEESLWNLRNLLEDMGIKVPQSSLKLPLQQIIAKSPVFGGTVEDDEYDGKVKSKIVATFKKAQYEEVGSDSDDDEDDEGGSATAEVDDEEETAVESDDDLEELELDDI